MVNRKQESGQDFCKCGHKEFHHNRTFDGKYICCMKNCDYENFEKREENAK